MAANRYVIHVISNTHWDREGHFSLQRQRMMLIEMIDLLLEILRDNPEYKAYHLGSQSIHIEDYLEIRPEKHQEIENFVKQKRLFIGPWYTLPDEFLVGGESLIRNLLLGHRVCRAFGSVMKVGYAPFSCGQISQMPQIYLGFNIDTILFYYGINSVEVHDSEFIWDGPDGSRLLASRFLIIPGHDFYFYIYRSVVFNERINKKEYKWHRGGTPFHFSDNQFVQEVYRCLNPVLGYYSENLKTGIKALKKHAKKFTTPNMIWMQEHEYSFPSEVTTRIIKDADKLLSDKVIHSTLPDYIGELKEYIKLNKLKVVHGEQRGVQIDGASTKCYGYAVSARIDIKHKNFEAEKWLQYYAEPLAIMTNQLGNSIQEVYIEKAWKYLLKNQMHNVIGGYSIDKVYADVYFRFNQSIEISKGIVRQAAQFIGKNLDLKDYPDDGIYLVLLNTLPYERSEVVELFIDVPIELGWKNLSIKDLSGKDIPLQIVGKRNTKAALEQPFNCSMYFSMNRYHCFVEFKNLPSMGYKTFLASPQESKKTKNLPNLSLSDNSLENSYLKVNINENGTLDVFAKEIGYSYSGLGYFLDEGEAGTAWEHIPITPILTTESLKPKITLLYNGPLQAAFKIDYTWGLPLRRHRTGKKRASKLAPITISNVVSLSRTSKLLSFEIILDNTVKDHRIRICFPTDVDTDHSYAESQFDVVQRKIFQCDAPNLLERPMTDFPMNNFCGVSNGDLGAAVISNSFMEYEIFQDKRNTIAITLIRSFSNVVPSNSVAEIPEQTESQCLGKHRYKIVFYPHLGTWESGQVYAETYNHNFEIRAFQVGKSEGCLATKMKFLKVEQVNLIFSALKFAENGPGVVLRLFNPTKSRIEGKVSTYLPIRSIKKLTLEELEIEPLGFNKEKEFSVAVEPKKIVTLKIMFKGLNSGIR